MKSKWNWYLSDLSWTEHRFDSGNKRSEGDEQVWNIERQKSMETSWLLTNKWREHLHEADTKPNVSEELLLTRIFFPLFDCFSIYRLSFQEVWNVQKGIKFLIWYLLKLKGKHFHTCQQTHLIVMTYVFLLSGNFQVWAFGPWKK